MPAGTQALIEMIRPLAEERVAEVEDFVDFLAGKASRTEALDRLLAHRSSATVKSSPRSKRSAPHATAEWGSAGRS